MGYAPRPYVPAPATGASSTTGEPTTISGGSSQPRQLSWTGDGRFDGLSTYRNFNSSTNGFTTTTDKTSWELDPARRWPVAKNYSDGTRIQMPRDAVGNLRAWIGGRSITNTYSRDAADQITGLAYSDGTPGVSYTYSLRGLITNLLDAAGNHDFVYDHCNRVTSETGTNLALTMTYCTNSDERASLTLAMGGTDVLTVDYAFGASGRLTAVTASQPGSARGLTFRYDWYTNENRIAAICAPNGVTNQYQYQTNADLVSAIRIWGATTSATPLLAYTYAYDDANRCTNFARPYENRRDLYAYDAAGYLVKAQRQVTGVWSTAQWCFDTAGNRVSETNGITGRVATYLHNALNQIRSCSYDLDGNLTTNGAWSYTWDAENRLTSAVSNGTLIATYQYDAQNRRISKTVGTTTHTYLYDGWNLVAETISNQQSTITNLFVWGADHAGSLATDSGGVRGLLAIISGASVYYPVMNNHGDVMALFDATGTNIVARYERDPFGVLLSATGPAADSCPFGFQTKYCDPETGLIYFGHRYYEPTLAAWLCRDPLEEEGGINLYGVTGGDPVNGIDPLGLFDVPTHGNMAISAMTELNGKLGLTRAQYNDLLRGVCEGSSFPDTQTRIRLPPGFTLPIMQDIQRFDQFVDYPADQAKKGLKFVSKKMGELNTAAIGLVWADYPRLNNGVMNWWDHGPSFLGPAFAWGSKYSAKVDVLNQTHFGPLAWQHGMSEKGMTAGGLQSKMVSGSLDNMARFTDNVSKGNYYDAGFELGKTLHYLQDTYTPSHVERNAKGQITAFFDYNLQSPTLHAKEDKPEFRGPVYNTAALQSQTLIMMFLKGQTTGIAGLFQTDPDVRIGEPGRRFVTEKEMIAPTDIFKGNWRQ